MSVYYIQQATKFRPLSPREMSLWLPRKALIATSDIDLAIFLHTWTSVQISCSLQWLVMRLCHHDRDLIFW